MYVVQPLFIFYGIQFNCFTKHHGLAGSVGLTQQKGEVMLCMRVKFTLKFCRDLLKMFLFGVTLGSMITGNEYVLLGTKS